MTFPYFSGYADETGEGAGEGFTIVYSLPLGTSVATWMAALDEALAHS